MPRALSRRGLLASGAAVAVLGGGGYAGLALGEPAPGARVLAPEELDLVRAAALAMFPGPPLPLDGVQAGVAERVDEIVADLMDPTRAAAFRYVLRALELGTFASRGVPFTGLSNPDRQAVLENWSEPAVLPRRLASDSLRTVLGMAYFSHPEILRAIGWQPGCGGAG